MHRPPDRIDSPGSLSRIISTLSEGPGVYLMKDEQGRIIYVGKAINLQKRVASYFQRQLGPASKTALMVSRVAGIETVVTASEKEALILESNLIKRYRPRYNVVLKDDKRYPSIRINTEATYPKIEVVRQTPPTGARYFGPFSSAQAVRQTVKLINKTFPLRKCSDRSMGQRSRPCIHHQMGQCLAPCCLEIDPKAYHRIVKEVILFLRGRTPELIRRIRRHMLRASERQDYETAAALRDRMVALQKTLERQVTVSSDFLDRDVIGISGSGALQLVTVMTLRRGFLQGVRHFEFEHAMSERGEWVAQFLGQYYGQLHDRPVEVLVPELPENAALLEEALSEGHRRRVRIRQPQRGEKRRLLEMAENNARNTLRERLEQATRETVVLEVLKQRLNLVRIPMRIECFDNSNLAGTHPVSGMVVFVAGRPHKAGYRRFNLRTVTSPDDYAGMAEVLRRRYSKITAAAPEPDLLLVDGGKGQLNIALAVLGQLGLGGRFAVAGIAKKNPLSAPSEDKIYLPHRANPVQVGSDRRWLLLLQQIRDEAHRVALGFQRKQRRRGMVQSALDGVAGVGTKRKALLMKHFGGIEAIRAATVEEISALPGIHSSLAKAIKQALVQCPSRDR